jgi:hypothetical protein
MADVEIHVPFEKISNSQTITQENIKMFKEHGMDIHKNEVAEIVDDHGKQKRIYKIKNVKYFGPWSKRG